ncbi:MAG: cadherin-like domain-containing protein [Planctomycetales bacterium]|nr:cadherin-like domain-containing protein [Planctomycetales bacterium]
MTSLSGNDDFISSVTVQADGKILVTGRLNAFNPSADTVLVRYNADGSLDTSFGGGDGIVTTTISANIDYGADVTVQSDGKILVSGLSYNGSNYDFALSRYNTDGSLDTTFDSDGIVTTDFSSSADYGNKVSLQSDGKILVSGYSTAAGLFDFALVRYNTDGSLDTTFDGDGRVITPVGPGQDYVQDMTLQSDGKILVTGYVNNGSNQDFALVRYNTDGSLDTSFGGGDGIVTTAIGAASDYGQSVQVQSDGKIVVGGYADIGGVWEFALTRYNSDGTLDASFGGGDGIVTTDVGPGFDSGRSLTIQSDGKILLAGISSNGSNDDFALVRYNSDGTLDTTFDLTNKLDGTPTFTEGGSAVVLDADVEVRDSELDAFNSGNGNYSGASLTIVRNGGASTEDVLSFNDGNGITLSGGNLLKNSQVIATFDITSTPGQLAITFTDANGEIPTSADVDNILRQITYANSSDTPPASVQLDWTFDDGNTGAQGSGGALQAPGSVTVNITAVNDSPVLTNGAVVVLSATDEDTVSTPVQVSSLLSSSGYSDADTGAQSGIALTGLTGNGAWEYSTDGTTWAKVFPYVSSGGAQLLNSTSWLRYHPNSLDGESVSLTFRAWDQTSGTASTNAAWSIVSTAGNGGSTAFSTEQATASLSVTPINDAPQFGFGDGLTITPDAGTQSGRGVAIQADGKVVVAGGTTPTTTTDILVRRYNSDGSLDTSFATLGKFQLDLEAGNDFAYDVAIQTDGKIVISGNARVSGNTEYVVARLNSDGTLDTTFGGTGVVITPVGTSSDLALTLEIQTDGKIVAAGYATSSGNLDFAAVRYNVDGTLDTSFGGTGKVIASFGSGMEIAWGVTLQSDGKIVLGGWSTNADPDFSLARLNVDGSLDTSFGGTGMVSTPLAGSQQGLAVDVQTDGKLLLSGYSNGDMTILRYNSDGSLDSSFGASGIASVDFAGGEDQVAYNVTALADGRIIVGGTATVGSQLQLGIARLNADGSLDNTFGTSGIVTVPVGLGDISAGRLTVHDDGTMAYVGDVSNGTDNDIAVVRLTADGALDASFNVGLGGTVSFVEGGVAVVLDSNVQIYDAELSVADDFNGTSLTIVRNGGASTEDVLSFNDGNGITLSGSSLLKNSQVIATFDITSTPGQLAITFTDANGEIPTSADVDNILRQIAYANTSSYLAGTVQLDWTFDDGNTTNAQGIGSALQALGSSTVTLVDSDRIYVDTTSDVSDGDTSSIAALLQNKGTDGFVSLREAIEAANSTVNVGGPDEIYFNLTTLDAGYVDPDATSGNGDEYWQFLIGSLLPTITDGVVIDGETQAGADLSWANRHLAIQIENRGLVIAAADVTIQGLSIGNVIGTTATSGFAINHHGTPIELLAGAQDVLIRANHLGVDAAGTAALPSMQHGIVAFDATSFTLGGTSEDDRNILGGMQRAGIWVHGVTQATIQNNYFGLGADDTTLFDSGTNTSGSARDAVYLWQNAAANQIDLLDNVIVNHGRNGLLIVDSANVTVQGNHIGITPNETLAGNASAGVLVSSGTNIRIGGVNTGEGNVIAGNGGTAIAVGASMVTPVPILGNLIYGNADRGIDLNADGITANDFGDADTGPNDLQNYPVLQYANSDGVGSINILGTLNSGASTTYRLEFFATDTGDGSGHGEAERFLGFTSVTTDGSGNATFSVNLSAVVVDGEFVTATATKDLGAGNYGGTSEFALNLLASTVNDAPVLTAPGAALTATEQTNLVIHGTGFSVSDADEANSGAIATLSVGEGALTIVVGDSGVTIDSGNGTGNVQISGTIAQINNLLTGTGTGTITYLNSSDTPSATTTLTVKVNDQGNTGTDPGLTGDATSEEGTNSVTINITPVNDAPTIAVNAGAVVNEGGQVVIDNTVLSGSDPDDSAVELTYSVTAGLLNGQLESTLAPGVAISSFTQDDVDNGRIVYVHNGSETTSDTFDFALADGGEDGAPAATGTFSITVNLVNDHSVSAIVDTNANTNAVAENSLAGTQVAITAFAQDGDMPDTVTYSLLDAAGGRFAIDANTGVVTVADGQLLNYENATSHTITVQALSTDGSTSQTNLLINVLDVNEQPTVQTQTYSTNYVDNLIVTAPGVLGTAVDQDGDALSAVLTMGPSSGVVSLAADGSFVFDPAPNVVGNVVFSFVVTDGQLNSVEQTVTIVVTAPNVINAPNNPVDDSDVEPEDGGGNATTNSGDGNSVSNVASDQETESTEDTSTQLIVLPELLAEPPTDEASVQSLPRSMYGLESTESLQSAVSNEEQPLELVGVRMNRHVFSLHKQDLSKTRFSTSEQLMLEQIQTSQLVFAETHQQVQKQLDSSYFRELDPVITTAIGTVIVVWAVHAGQVLATLVSTASVCVQVDPLTILQNAEDLGGIADTREEQLFETEKAVGSGANS